MVSAQLGISGGEGWVQFGELGLAFALSALIGAERELRQKSAGLRTHTLVGVASALIMLVSKYGFTNVLVPGHIILDPSRVAAQIVSGIGFLGAGLIFVRRDAVRGLTTAAAVWVVAAVGMASGAGLPLLAVAVTGLYFVTLYGLTPLARRLPVSASALSGLQLHYQNGKGALRRILDVCTTQGFQIADVSIANGRHALTSRAVLSEGVPDRDGASRNGTVTVTLVVYGRRPVAGLAAGLQEIDGVLSVSADDANASDE